jgi:putative ABC transport system permease protein
MEVPLVRRNLQHEKGKLALSVAGIAAAISLILILLGFRAGLYDSLSAFVDHVGADLIVAQSGTEGMFSASSILPLDIHDEAARAADAVEAGHIVVASVIFTRAGAKTPVLLTGYDPAAGFAAPWKLGAGRPVARSGEMVMDTWLADRTGTTLGDRVDLLGRAFEVVGLSRETSSWMSPYVFVTIEDAAASLGAPAMVSYHLLRLPVGASRVRAAAAIEAAVPGVDVLVPDDVAAADRRVVASVLDRPLVVMLVIGAVIGSAVIGLTAYAAVADRLRDYGVLKAVGAGGRRLAWLVVVETMYRSVLGYVFGVGLAFATASAIMAAWPQFNIVITPETVGQAGLASLAMTLIAALLPLRWLSRVDPVLVFK